MNEFEDLLDKEESSEFYSILKKVRLESFITLGIIGFVLTSLGISLDWFKALPVMYMLILGVTAYQFYRPRFLYDFEWESNHLKVYLLNLFGEKVTKEIKLNDLKKYKIRKHFLSKRYTLFDNSFLQNYKSIEVIGKKGTEILIPKMNQLKNKFKN